MMGAPGMTAADIEPDKTPWDIIYRHWGMDPYPYGDSIHITLTATEINQRRLAWEKANIPRLCEAMGKAQDEIFSQIHGG